MFGGAANATSNGLAAGSAATNGSAVDASFKKASESAKKVDTSLQTAKDKANDMKDKVGQMMDKVASVGNALFKKIMDVSKSIMSGKPEDMISSIADLMTMFMDLNALLEPLVEAFAPFNDMLSTIADGILQGLTPAIQTMADKFTDPNFVGGLVNLGISIGTLLIPMLNGVLSVMDSIGKAKKNWDEFVKSWDNFWNPGSGGIPTPPPGGNANLPPNTASLPFGQTYTTSQSGQYNNASNPLSAISTAIHVTLNTGFSSSSVVNSMLSGVRKQATMWSGV